ncbi:MAG: hypothetical protein V2A57_04210 [Elusimicrobiota bacterium]
MPVINRYFQALFTIPAPGGNGCHPALLSIANLGTLSGKDPDEIFSDIRQAIPPGTRRVADREIQDAIKKAIADHSGGTYTPQLRPKPVVSDGKSTLQRIIGQAVIDNVADLWEASPIRLLDDPKQDPALLLETLYKPTDLLFIGDRQDSGIMGRTIRPAADWISYFHDGGKKSEHIIINPLTGQAGLTKDGKESYRADSCVKDFKYCLIEFDTLNRQDQIRFWSAVKLPIVALIDTGGKSIHAWIDAQRLARVGTLEQWQTEIKGRLYDQILKPLGVDGACANPARLSRLPGHLRQEKKAMQKILWLSREGQSIC